jgi:hypothetical protein
VLLTSMKGRGNEDRNDFLKKEREREPVLLTGEV